MSSNVAHVGLHFCMDTLTESNIETIIKAIKTDSPNSVETIQQIMTNDKARSSQIPQWKDKDGLNIVHYSICYDRPDVLLLFMKQTDAFSSADHQPDISPYAHLAATVGAADCLDIILTVRPQDYFETFLPKHTIVLPADLGTFPSGMIDVVKKKIYSRPAVKMNKFQTQNYRQQLNQRTPVHSKTNIRSVNRKQMLIREWRPSSLPDIPRKTTLANRRSTLTNRRSTLTNRRNTLVNSMSNFDNNRFQSGLKLPHIRQSSENIKTFDGETISNQKSTNDSPKATLLKKGLPRKGNLKMTIPKIDYSEPDTLPIEPSRKYSEELDHLQDCIENLQYQRKFMFRTPIKLAAERNHIECIKTILTMRTLTNNSYLSGKGFLVLAAVEESVDAINILINDDVSDRDLFDAINFVTRKLIPGSFRPLIRELRKRRDLYNHFKVNLYHAIFEASLKMSLLETDTPSFDNLTKMVEILIEENEDVNKWNSEVPGTYPLYTLIEKAFLSRTSEHFTKYMECLKILLENKANQYYNESLPFQDDTNKKLCKLKPGRKLYTSALECIFQYKKSAKYIPRSEMKIRVRRILELIKDVNDNKGISPPSTCLTQQHELMLFQYLRNTLVFGVDPYVLTFILNLKVDPNTRHENAYAVNAYFDTLLPDLEPGDVKETFDRYKPDIDSLAIVCGHMSLFCLKDAVKKFVDKHLFNRMLHVIPIVRYFCYIADNELKKKELHRKWKLAMQAKNSEVNWNSRASNWDKLKEDLLRRVDFIKFQEEFNIKKKSS